MTTAPICGNCAHANTVATFHADSPKLVECAICRGATSLRIERGIVVRILEARLEAVRGMGKK
jgi:hypothetical protein